MRYLGVTHKRKYLMEFHDHREVTRCYRCNGIDRAYIYIPILGNIFTCSKCAPFWNYWGMSVFKEMIGFE
jgi:hypothetical protein